MNGEQRALYWEAVRLASEGASEFLDTARRAKVEIADAFYELWYRTNVLDNLVAQREPDAEWVNGVPSEGRDAMGKLTTPTTPAAVRPGRPERIEAIVKVMVSQGASTIQTANVVEILQRDGYEGKARDLAVSVGNILARSGAWKRVNPGIYEPIL